MRWLMIAFAAVACLLAAGGDAAAQIRFDGNASTSIVRCDGGDGVVRGSGNRLTLSGGCRNLTVAGSDNIIAADLAPGAVVRITGNNNRVLYDPARGGPPEATTLGAYNEILPGPGAVVTAPPVVAAAPAPLVLEKTPPAPGAIACAGRDVVVRGAYRAYDLRGGCRSLTIEGPANTVRAELLPGALVTIGGSAVIVNYALVADGPPPVVRVTVPGLAAKHLQRFGETQLTIPAQ